MIRRQVPLLAYHARFHEVRIQGGVLRRGSGVLRIRDGLRDEPVPEHRPRHQRRNLLRTHPPMAIRQGPEELRVPAHIRIPEVATEGNQTRPVLRGFQAVTRMNDLQGDQLDSARNDQRMKDTRQLRMKGIPPKAHRDVQAQASRNHRQDDEKGNHGPPRILRNPRRKETPVRQTHQP